MLVETLEPTEKVQNIVPTSRGENIDDVLSVAFQNSLKSPGNEIYKAIFEAGREAGIKGERERAYYARFSNNDKKSLEPYAEAFYILLSSVIGKDNIVQHRIVLDYATGVPTVLSVGSETEGDNLELLQDVSYNLARSSYRMGKECQFWVITNHNLDQTSIDHDFPFCRSKNVDV